MSNFKKHRDAPKGNWRVIKKILKYLLILIVVLAAGIILFVNLSPTFGSNPSKEQKETYETFDNYADGKFFFQPSEEVDAGIDRISGIPYSESTDEERRPPEQLPVAGIDWDRINSNEDSLTWLGHSAFILSIDNKKILVDPMLGPTASPVSFIGPKRYSEDLLYLIEEMPPIDAVFITHDHYDHLDYESIKRLKSKVAHFIVPYGVGNHLVGWDIAEEDITEMNWWDETEFEGLAVALTPAKHFSGRGILNHGSTLWGGWVILGEQTRFYISGDGGYDTHFKEIADQYGPFDIALIEGAQYDERWPDSHMIPEESVQASIDLQAEQMMLTHWGGFTLARHSWTEPIERAIQAAEKQGVDLIAPQIGETVPMDGESSDPVSEWLK
ncbi:MBL fold metallo-hydrolase [Planomicrobium sp. Y74]|nr:MBL fold metallo-hydrolase [Planomicrobium sp. Y74]